MAAVCREAAMHALRDSHLAHIASSSIGTSDTRRSSGLQAQAITMQHFEHALNDVAPSLSEAQLDHYASYRISAQ